MLIPRVPIYISDILRHPGSFVLISYGGFSPRLKFASRPLCVATFAKAHNRVELTLLKGRLRLLRLHQAGRLHQVARRLHRSETL